MKTHQLEIHSQARSYNVFLGRGLLSHVGGYLQEMPFGRQCAVITDDNVAPLYAELVLSSLRQMGVVSTLITVPAGENSKSLTEAEQICNAMIREGLDRHAFVVALGGGVIGDLAGFVAAIYYRGIPLVQIPTTVIALCDSAIGGKTGVNTVLGKNLLGAFYPPSLVIADVDSLDSLPKRAFNEGFAEVIKHGVIRDCAMLDKLAAYKREDLVGIVRRNLEIKAEIVAADEYERTGLRALLNFGHTIGHAVEQAAGYGRLLHGEAVSLGMVAAGRLSMEKAGLPQGDYEQMVGLLEAFHLPTTLPTNLSTDAIMESLARDKKFEAGQIRFILTPGLGQAFLSEQGQVTQADLRRMVEGLR